MTDATQQSYHRPIKHFACCVVTLRNNPEAKPRPEGLTKAIVFEGKIPQQVKSTENHQRGSTHF